ncbi:hypothetical protein Tco_0757163 [Tanacetum coccineum]
MSMTIQSSVKDKILVAQGEASKVENATAKMLHDQDQQMEKKEDGGLCLYDPEDGDSLLVRLLSDTYGIGLGSDEYACSMLAMVPWDRMGTPTRMKIMAGPAPHTQIDADCTAGMGLPDNGPKLMSM